MKDNPSQTLRLKPGDPIPGLRCDHQERWLDLQLIMLNGETISPLLPLGSDAAYVWVPKNGCSSLKRAWLQASGTITNITELESTYVHGAVLPFTHWLRPNELRAVAEYRNLIAIWRDPIDRYVSACRSHLNQLTTKLINARLNIHARGDQSVFDRNHAKYDSSFRKLGIQSLDDNADPRDLMNQVALELNAWVCSFLEWTHHTLPQIRFLGNDPSLYTTILGMNQIGELVNQWRNASGQYIQQKAENVSKDHVDDPFRMLSRGDLNSQAIDALESFYACDRDFLEHAQEKLGSWTI
ncbi:MAG: sulfotransferase family 2 domain-containing protein [Prochlorococcaceae cyanobacterium ETNP18_MAG_14]|nr:sulfotransferase family 2 domain-containing protein [Prochlorococcaceae cyanobacterium ETNP18_MAG_14]